MPAGDPGVDLVLRARRSPVDDPQQREAVAAQLQHEVVGQDVAGVQPLAGRRASSVQLGRAVTGVASAGTRAAPSLVTM